MFYAPLPWFFSHYRYVCRCPSSLTLLLRLSPARYLLSPSLSLPSPTSLSYPPLPATLQSTLLTTMIPFSPLSPRSLLSSFSPLLLLSLAAYYPG